MRLWNSFNILAVILLAIAITGLLSGGKMVFDPGRAANGKEWLLYLVAGGLMLINGLLPAPPSDEKEIDATAKRNLAKVGNAR
jgi:hypothetical protein